MTYPNGLIATDVCALIRFYVFPAGTRDEEGSRTITRLHRLGLIDREDNLCGLTDRGRTFVQHILNLPLPTQSWSMS